MSHSYELKLSGRVDKCIDCAFVIDPTAKDDCPDEFKGIILEVVDFASNIHAKRDHDLTCRFPETHKYKVHQFNFGPKMVSVDGIGIGRVLYPENVVFYCFSKEKVSVPYDQQATSSIISIVKHVLFAWFSEFPVAKITTNYHGRWCIHH